jgi:hypothetical protein
MRWVFAFWGALLAAIALAGAVFFDFLDPAEPALFGGAVATMAILAALVWRLRADVAGEQYLRAHPDVSLPVPWLGVAIALLAYSLEVGWWLSLIAGGMIVAGIVGLVGERRAERETLRRAEQHAGLEGHPPW